jgi:hypothetical protein
VRWLDPEVILRESYLRLRLKRELPSIQNSRFHKEKEMADFRKWFYALAVVALFAGLTTPASAQVPPFNCSTSVSVVPIVRAEGYTELVGDIQLTCNGGVPTTPGQLVPQANITVFLNTNVTSKLTSGGLYNEALLLIDEPNYNLRPNPNPILNCGNFGASDAGPSGPGVCAIVATTDPSRTYDGTSNGYGSTGTIAGGNFATLTCDGQGGRPSATTNGLPTYGCGRPNVFQGRIGTPQNPGQVNAVTFLGVPLDPPGTTTTRTLRITNVRANAAGLGVSTTFVPTQIQANIAINSQNAVTIASPQQLVAYINRGLTVGVYRSRLDFIQCYDQNPDLYKGTAPPAFITPSYQGTQGANFVTGVDKTPMVRFTEGFAASWKTKNVSFTVGDGTTAGNATYSNGWFYNGNRNYPADVAQNVPGAVYNTEAGFEWNGGSSSAPSTQPTPNPNPPNGYATSFVNQAGQGLPLRSTAQNNGGNIFGGAGIDTGINLAGIASQGTRLSLTFSNVPSGASIFLAPVIYLFRQGSPYTSTINPNPASRTGGTGLSDPNIAGNTGVMVLTSTDSAGSGVFTRIPSTGATTLQKAGNLAVYEILYTDPFSLEVADVPAVVAYVANLTQNLPTPGLTTQATGGFAPFYTTSSAGQPSGTLPIPRFLPGTTPMDLFLINKCACNLLFPYVVSAAGYDTGIAIANSSADPGNANGEGFFGVPQSGTVTFWYYGVMANGGAVPGKQTSKSVPAGQVLTYVASSGSTDWGLDGRAAGLIGYVITQAQFQYCHAFAYISALGAGPLTPGTSEGYLGLVLDYPGVWRTNQVGENTGN